MIGDKSINTLCANCKFDFTIPGPPKNCPRCGAGVFNTTNNLNTAQGQPNKVAPSYTAQANQNMNKRNSGFGLNSITRLN